MTQQSKMAKKAAKRAARKAVKAARRAQARSSAAERRLVPAESEMRPVLEGAARRARWLVLALLAGTAVLVWAVALGSSR